MVTDYERGRRAGEREAMWMLAVALDRLGGRLEIHWSDIVLATDTLHVQRMIDGDAVVCRLLPGSVDYGEDRSVHPSLLMGPPESPEC